jgi:hypothetical protein
MHPQPTVNNMCPTSLHHQDANPNLKDYPQFQDLDGCPINPLKLSAMLRAKFGYGRYEIHVRLRR